MREHVLPSRSLAVFRVVTLTAIVALGAASTAWADGRGRGGEERIQGLVQQLALDARQQTALRAVFEQAAADRAALRALPRGSAEARQARHQLRERMKAGIERVLTAEQRTRMQQLRQERRLDHLTRRLGLDARQVEAVRAILADAAGQTQPSVQRGASRHDLWARTRSRISEVLTPTQRARFEQLREHRGGHRGGHHGPCRRGGGGVDT